MVLWCVSPSKHAERTPLQACFLAESTRLLHLLLSPLLSGVAAGSKGDGEARRKGKREEKGDEQNTDFEQEEKANSEIHVWTGMLACKHTETKPEASILTMILISTRHSETIQKRGTPRRQP